ncbi:MAG TPA: sugar nucleotide-binding protein, partial [Burkholderiales bacterium]|nr:sugar nucleotide-binding protein [Burkholderiales bacterium]
NVYGRSKAEAESRVLELHPDALVVRTSAFFGPWDEYNYVTIALRTLAAGHPFAAATDLVVSPTYLPDLVNASLDLLIDGAGGLWHLSNTGAVSWADFALGAARAVGIHAHTLSRCTSMHLPLKAKRPAYSVLGSGRAALMPSLADALDRYAALCRARFLPAVKTAADAA